MKPDRRAAAFQARHDRLVHQLRQLNRALDVWEEMAANDALPADLRRTIATPPMPREDLELVLAEVRQQLALWSESWDQRK